MEGIGIDVAGLSKKLGPTRALAGLDLKIEPGLLHGLIGPDGAGKTTTMRMLIGLLRPDAGSIAFHRGGSPVAFDEIRPGMAYMPQRQSLYSDLSVGEHMDFFRDLYRLPSDIYETRRRELLSITRLEKFVERPAGQLSGGMYKKLGLMCALLQSPNVLLLDEPTNGVDPISRREFWDLLYRIIEDSKTTVLVSTAYMDEAERCARVHLIDGGKTLAEGAPRTVLREAGVSNFDELFLKREAAAK